MKFVLEKRFRGRQLVVVLGSRPERRLLRAVAAPGVATAAAVYGLRRLGRRCGVTAAEAAEALPGDEIVAEPMWQSTRAVAIGAPPEEVWPWIVQMGFPSHRAGWYTPHWLDRLTFGIEHRSADRIVPELQQLAIGDRVPDSDGAPSVRGAAPDDALRTDPSAEDRGLIESCRVGRRSGWLSCS